MNCPYCGFTKTDRKKKSFGTYVCPRCDYQFEVSSAHVILDRILSVPFSSILYTPVIFIINYYFGKLAYNEESYLSFGVLVAFLLIISAFVSVFIYFIIIGRSSRIFIVQPHESRKTFLAKLLEINPLIKIAVMLTITAIFVGIFINQAPF